MKVMDVVKKLEKSSKFKELNKKSYLAHLFKMMDDLNKDIWQIGYYNEDGTITTFIIEKKDIKIVPEQEVFQKTKRKVKKLDIDKVKIDLDKALDIVKDLQQKKFSGNTPLKIMVVLQNIANHIVYNITYITNSFNTLNMKIDGINGKVISYELTPMLQFQGKAS